MARVYAYILFDERKVYGTSIKIKKVYGVHHHIRSTTHLPIMTIKVFELKNISIKKRKNIM